MSDIPIGAEVDERGHLQGRDPRTMTQADIQAGQGPAFVFNQLMSNDVQATLRSILPRAKGAVVGQQWALCMHGFGGDES